MIIAFSGTDGAGKSTQIDRLMRRLTGAGHRVEYVWARGGYTPGMRAMKRPILWLMGRKSGADAAATQKAGGYAARRAGLMRRSLVARVWLAVAMLDLAVLYGVYVRFLSARGRIIICDRYVDDTKIDFMRNFPGLFRDSAFLWRFLERVAPSPDVHFLLTVPVEVSVARSLAKNEPFPDHVSTLEFRLEHYRAMQARMGDAIHSLSGTAPIERVAAEIDAALCAARPGILPA